MRQDEASQTDWARVLHDINQDAPIPFDDEDRAAGLYDPNNEAEVDEFLRTATTIRPRQSTEQVAPKKLVSLELSQDVLDHYRAKAEDWQTAIDEALRRSMNA